MKKKYYYFIGIIVLIAIVLILLILPVKTQRIEMESYTEEVPINYEVVKPVQFIDKNNLTAETYIKNIDTVPGNFSVIFVFTDTEGKEDKRLAGGCSYTYIRNEPVAKDCTTVKPGDTASFTVANSGNWTDVEGIVTVSNKTVQKTRNMTREFTVSLYQMLLGLY